MAAATDTLKDAQLRFESLKTKRRPWEPLYQDVSDFCNVTREDWTTDDTKEGQQPGQETWDGTAQSALRLRTKGIHGYMISPAYDWLAFNFFDPLNPDDPEIRLWLDACEEHILNQLVLSNFYAQTLPAIGDISSVGYGVTYMEEDLAANLCYFMTLHPKEVYIANDRYGRADTVFRRFRMEGRNLKKKFEQEGKIPPKLLLDIAKNPYKGIEVIHGVYPREERDGSKVNSKNMAFTSLWWMTSGGEMLLESGYKRLPYAVCRHQTVPGTAYSNSPAMEALSDIKGINVIAKALLNSVEFAVLPPLNIPASMKGKEDLSPFGRNYYQNPNERIYPVEMSSNFPAGIEREEQKRRAIREAFDVDYFLMLAQAEREMTAREVIEKQGEKAAILGADIGQFSTEYLAPILNLLFNIENEAGRLPPPPKKILEAGGGQINITFLGPLAQAQRTLFKTQGIVRTVEAVGGMATNMQRPDLLDNLDLDGCVTDLGIGYGMQQKRLRTPEQVAQLRQERAAAMQQAQQGVQQDQALEGVDKITKNPVVQKLLFPQTPAGTGQAVSAVDQALAATLPSNGGAV